jgi:eukaryotic-like serine/threonine-protein kinase
VIVSGSDIPEGDRSTSDGLVLGKYRPLLLLGQGGMGDVYLAAADGLGGLSQIVVIKRLRNVNDPHFIRMFLNEAHIARQLGHPNIVQTHDVGREGAAHFIVMEYLDGPNLGWLRRAAEPRGGVPWAIEIQILHDVLEGLHYAHELRGGDGRLLQLVHRDLSPDNVIVTRRGDCKILDFGIAKAANSTLQTQAGFIKGKLGHMPPEQLRGKPVDRRADIFAAGVLLFEGLSGQTLWGTLESAAVSAHLMAGDIPPVRELAPQIPEALLQICERALAPDPADRYDSALDMREALLTYAERHGLTFNRLQVADLVEPLFRPQRDGIDRAIRGQLERPGRHLSVVGPWPTRGSEVFEPRGRPTTLAASAPRARGTATRRLVAGISVGVMAAAAFWLWRTPALDLPAVPPPAPAAIPVEVEPVRPPPIPEAPIEATRAPDRAVALSRPKVRGRDRPPRMPRVAAVEPTVESDVGATGDEREDPSSTAEPQPPAPVAGQEPAAVGGAPMAAEGAVVAQDPSATEAPPPAPEVIPDPAPPAPVPAEPAAVPGRIFSRAPLARVPGPPLPRVFQPEDGEQLAGMCRRIEAAAVTLAGVSPEFARGLTAPMQKQVETDGKIYPVAMYYFIVREAALKHDSAAAAAALAAAHRDGLILRFKDLPAIEASP